MENQTNKYNDFYPIYATFNIALTVCICNHI